MQIKVTPTNNQTIAHPMMIPWLMGTHNEIVGYDVHLGKLHEQHSPKIGISTTHPNQKNATA